jgi:acyl transferase domain-containing protein
MNTRRGHFIDAVDAFDNDFFGIAPIEAAALDPSSDLLQSSWRDRRCRDRPALIAER